MAKKNEQPNMLPALKAQLKAKEPQSLYFFYGEETFLLHHYLGQMKKIIVDELTESFNYHKFNSETFDIRTFADAVENLPMMAERTMICVDDVDIFKFDESKREAMVEILGDIPEYCTVVFVHTTDAWSPDKRLKKLWSVVEENAMLVEFVKQDQRELITWVTRHFAANKKNIAPELCAYLIDITGGTMTALAGEISKICAYSGADTIVKSDIDAVTEPVLDAVAFRMTDYLTQGAYGQALLELRRLMKMQEEPIRVLGAVGKHFRSISAARTFMDHNRKAPELAKAQGIWDSVAQKSMDAARKTSARFCARALELIMETDRAMKTSLDDPERLLEVLVLRLSKEAQNA